MQPPLKITPWLVLAAALLGAPAPAGAQTHPADAVDVPCLVATANCAPQVIHDSSNHAEVAAAGHPVEVFHAVTTAFIIAASADISVSMYQIHQGEAREVGFGAQWQDSPVAFALTKGAMAAGFAYGLQRMHKSRPKTALILGVAATALESWLTVRSARVSPSRP